MPKHQELIDLLEHAEGPDADLDWLVAADLWQKDKDAAYTASVDAALSLADKALPKGSRITTMGDDAGLCCYCRFVIFPNGLAEEEGKIDVKAWHQDFPIAIILATLKAREAAA